MDHLNRLGIPIDEVTEAGELSKSPHISELIFESSPDCVKILDLAGQLLSMNANGQCAMEIGDFNSFSGKELWSLWPQESHQRIQAALHKARSGETGHFSSICPTAIGTPKWWDVLITPIRDQCGLIVKLLSVSRDITETHQASIHLHSIKERLRIATEAAGLGVWALDIKNFQLHLENERFLQIFGLDSRSESIDAEQFINSFIYPQDIPAFKQAIKATINHEDRFHFNCKTITSSGESRHIQFRGNLHHAEGKNSQLIGTVADLTDSVKLQRELEQSHDLVTKITQLAPGSLYQFVLHADGSYSLPYTSSMTEELFEVTEEEMQRDVGLFFSRLHEDDTEKMRLSITESATTMRPWHLEYRVCLPKKGERWLEGRANPMKLEDGSILWHGLTTDITQRKLSEEKLSALNDTLERHANYDALTGLPNRRLFRDRLNQEIKHAEAEGRQIALLFLDLDHFKEVNDLFGHDEGDALLAQAANRIHQCFRPADTIARLGGDEFTAILTDARDVRNVEQIAQQILDSLIKPFDIGYQQARISASIGITFFPGDARLPEDLIRNADQAMYLSKAAGRNQLSFFKQSMKLEALNRLSLINELRHALPNNQLELYYQPIVNLSTGEIYKAEALIRWNHPTQGLTSPAKFIGIAEETGLINEIGDWVFKEAVACSKKWSERIGKPFQISINRSPVQFLNNPLGLDWIEHLEESGINPNSIVVEITEGVLLNISDQTTNTLRSFRQGGIQFAIDDFGTGYSSMAYLKKLEIDYLKIDQSFVKDMLQDNTSKTIVETILLMAKRLGLQVIAEGVETKEQCNWLATQGCDYAQGYLFSKPIPIKEFEHMIFNAQNKQCSDY